MDESLWLLWLLSAALPIVAAVASHIGYGVGSRQWQEKVQAAHRYEVEAEERAHAAEEMCADWMERSTAWLNYLNDAKRLFAEERRACDRKRLGEIIWRLWGERDQMHAAILAYGNNPAGFDYGVLDAVERLEKERDALIALLSESHKANNPGVPEPNWVMMASAMQQSLDGHGGTIDEILTAIDSGTIATEAKAFIEQASVEVQEEAVRLVAVENKKGGTL